VPVKGYSLTSGLETCPEVTGRYCLRSLKLPQVLTINSSSVGTEDINSSYWAFLKTPPDKNAAIQAYIPDTFLITTRWGQGYPYNSMNPQIDGIIP
jgi:hypothetical protein